MVSSFLNTILLLLSISFFKLILVNTSNFDSYSKKEFLQFVIGLGFIPIFTFSLPIGIHLLIILISLLYFLLVFENKFSKYILIIMFFLTIFSSLYSVGALSYDGGNNKYVFSNNSSIISVKQIENQKLYLKQLKDNLLIYKLANHNIADIFYNDLFTLYPVLVNMGRFLNLANFYNILLLANLYPLFLGIKYFNSSFKNPLFIYLSFLSLIISAGIYIYNSNPEIIFVFTLPIISLILLGILKVNINIYNFLLLISILITYLVKTV